MSLPEGWRETSLGELVNIYNTKRVPLSKQVRGKMKGIYPYYGASNIFDYINDYIFDGEYLLISEDGENLNTRNTPIAFIVNGKFWVNNHAHILQGKNKHISKYLAWYFSQLDISPFITGAVQPKLSKTNLLRIPIIISENMQEQKAIANILSSFDEKIELLKEQNETLEEMAQGVFREWFVDGVDESWEITTLGEVTNIKGGATPSTKNEDFWDGDIHWTSPKDLSNSKSTFLLDTSRKITKAGLKKISSGLLPKGTLLLSSRAPIGYLAISNVDISINQGYIALLDNATFSNAYMYFWLKTHMRLIEGASNGSTFQEISKTAFRQVECVLPDEKSLLKFDDYVKPILDKLLINIKHIQTLQKTRDTLLPKLMSGKLRVEGFV